MEREQDKVADYGCNAPSSVHLDNCMKDRAKRIKDYSSEYTLAREIVFETIKPALEKKNDLNLCIVRRLCEMMLRE